MFQLVVEYNFGLVLNGGNFGLGDDNFVLLVVWFEFVDEYYFVLMDMLDGGLGILIIWGIDVVYGYFNIVGVMFFLYNIGFGVVNDFDLIWCIGEIIVLEICVMGQDWIFVLIFVVVQNDIWGWIYEGYFECLEIVVNLSGLMVEGLQGVLDSDDLFGVDYIVVIVKYWVGDGGMVCGLDQGDNCLMEVEMCDIYVVGYMLVIVFGVQMVMVLFNFWYGVKMYGNGVMLIDVLVYCMGFDGFVVGDWEGYGQIVGCENENCFQVLFVGVDMYMVLVSWQEFYGNLLVQVEDGIILMEWFDEVVIWIFCVKVWVGLFDGVVFFVWMYVGDFDLIGSDVYCVVVCEVVWGLLVLLKNEGGLLLFNLGSNILFVGDGVDNICK